MTEETNRTAGRSALVVLKNVAVFVLVAFVALVAVEVLKLKVIPHFLH